MRALLRVAIGALFLSGLLEPAILCAENWPGWRGPRGDGTSTEQNIPIRWDAATGTNIAWKVPLPGVGHSSPVVWDDRIFLTTCLEETGARQVLCLDRSSGEVTWQKSVLTSALETRHVLNSHASGTPAADAERVYVCFLEVDGSTEPARNVSRPRDVTPGQMVVAACDHAGQLLWQVRPGPFTSVHGFCSSPVLFENLVIVNGDHDGDSYIVALDRGTGETVWKVARPHQTRSYVTPIIREAAGRTQLLFSGSKCVTSLDPRTGETIWSMEGPTEQFVASMVDDGEQFYVAGGFPTHHVLALRADGTGDVTGTHVVWHVTNAACYVPSPVVVGPYLFVPDDRGTANCFDTATGSRVWQARLGRHFSPSLIVAGGLVYFLSDDGLTRVVRPGPSLDIVAENPLEENCYASPAVSQGQIFIRTDAHLVAIGASP